MDYYHIYLYMNMNDATIIMYMEFSWLAGEKKVILKIQLLGTSPLDTYCHQTTSALKVSYFIT